MSDLLQRPSWIPSELTFSLPTADVDGSFRPLQHEAPSDSMVRSLAKLSRPAILGYALGCTEWVVYGLAGHDHGWAHGALSDLWQRLSRGRFGSSDAWRADVIARTPADVTVFETLVAAYRCFKMADFGPPASEAADVHMKVHLSESDNERFQSWSFDVLTRLALALPASSPDAPFDRSHLAPR